MRLDSLDKSAVFKYAAILVSVGLILLGCMTVLKPFLPALLLAAIFCVSTWPAFRWLEIRLHNRSRLAAFLMMLILTAFFVAPLVFLGSSLVESFHGLLRDIMQSVQEGPHDLPLWVTSLPVVGPHLQQSWLSFTSDPARMRMTVREFAGPVTEWMLLFGGNVGHGLFQVALGVFISFFMFRHGPVLVTRIRNLCERIGGPSSLRMLAIFESTMISLVYGILGTALVFAVLSTIAFYIAGVPVAPLLGLLTFLLGIVPGGPALVLIPVILWLFYVGKIGMGIFMIAWAAALTGLMDLVIRPYFISLGTKMPVILILLGVLGGVLSFGFIGLFIGPALLSVAYAMITEWSQSEDVMAEERAAND